MSYQTEQQLQQNIKYVCYEFKMLTLGFNILNERIFKKTDTESLILEAFLLHARNLVDFFCNKRNYEDDILALDFVGKKWEHGDILNKKNKQKEDDDPDREVDWYVGLNKQLSHITTGRSDKKNRTYFARKIIDGELVFVEIYNGLKKVVGEFNESVKDPELKIKSK